ncbi:FlgO family outer membrane protein [Ferrimonas senticii]|uniref:FlgO family outer membrane protein n=1 Tax=Ferrimonas senticii TaxID=394566 RepID=UPI00041F2A61|nr:FlgO family outer membrane protein [Ferrimonas senticii]
MKAGWRCGLLGLLLLGGCQTTYQGSSPLIAGNHLPPQGQLNLLSDQLAAQLRFQFDKQLPSLPLAVTTPVPVTDFEHSGHFAQVLEQALISSLPKRGFTVIELNSSETVRVSGDGNLLLSRRAEQLPQPQGVEQVLVTSFSLNANGIHLFSRVIQLTDNRVLSSAQSTLAWSQLPNQFYQQRSVANLGGKLSRDESRPPQPIWWQ